nr:rod shape-determining protein [Lachnospiraceae bacterium]
DLQMSNLKNHKCKKIGMDIIGTFLPEEVVDGVYKAGELAGLHVVNLTVEPIAARRVAIPERCRRLNMALVEGGAGTSDISITRDGCITAFGMIPVAGDSLTNVVINHCLVDFDTAESIKRGICENESVEFTDIMGLTQTAKRDDILKALDSGLEEMTQKVAKSIKELNSDHSPSAVFVVGGGGIVPGYTEKLADKLGIPHERVAVRGKEVMRDIVFEDESFKNDSLMVTPVGIALCFYDQNNNFIFVDFNGQKVKLYDNGNLTVADAAMALKVDNKDLFPKRGDALCFKVNSKKRIIRGKQGEAAVIKVNDSAADLYSKIREGDFISFVPSTSGDKATLELGKLPEFKESFTVCVNGKNVELPKTALVNNGLESELYDIKEGDDITINNYRTVAEIAGLLDLWESDDIYVNQTKAQWDTKVYEGFNISFKSLWDEDYEEEVDAKDAKDWGISKDNTKIEDSDDANEDEIIRNLIVFVNGDQITLTGKSSYVFVDVFDKIDFDLNDAKGRSIVTLVNGDNADYMQELASGDNIEIYWK